MAQEIDNKPEGLDVVDLRSVRDALGRRVNTEISVFWGRNNVFLAVNMALLALAATMADRPPLAFATALLGVPSSFVWLLAAIRGRAWLYYWEDRLAEIEGQLPPPHVFPGFWKQRKDRIAQGEPRPVTTLAFVLPVLVIGLWLAFMVYLLLG